MTTVALSLGFVAVCALAGAVYELGRIVRDELDRLGRD